MQVQYISFNKMAVMVGFLAALCVSGCDKHSTQVGGNSIADARTAAFSQQEADAASQKALATLSTVRLAAPKAPAGTTTAPLSTTSPGTIKTSS